MPTAPCKGWETVPGCVCTGPNNDVPSLSCLAGIVPNIINLAFAFLGAVTLLFLLWGAIRFITSTGDPKALQSAQKMIVYALIGMVVVLLSFVIINLVTQTLGLPSILSNFSLFIP